MKNRLVLMITICLSVALVLASATQLAAQGKKAGKGDMVRYSGRVVNISKNSSTITIQAKPGTLSIKYTDKTQFTYRNKPGSMDDVKEGRRVIVLLDPAQKDAMVATRVDVREGK